ncbi:unnamed protein product [Meloidogyne enterolobii]|uniref:Uncharacterized protein n=1 Tax=Meloidogyne enterolobii TaxID=390850 RepID=A0ACB0YXR9_MELEN
MLAKIQAISAGLPKILVILREVNAEELQCIPDLFVLEYFLNFFYLYCPILLIILIEYFRPHYYQLMRFQYHQSLPSHCPSIQSNVSLPVRNY